MKYVFAVTSHLTFYLTHRIVAQDEIKPDDCILFLVRGYGIPQKYDKQYPNQIHTSYNVTEDKGRVFAGVRFDRTNRNICEFDQLVDGYLHGENFLFYTPVCSNDICSLMVTKRNCVGYYVIEDGLASYRNYNPQTFTGIRYLVYKCILNTLFHRIYAVKNHFITAEHPKFRGCIASSPKCFPLHQKCLRVIGMPFVGEPIDIKPDVIISIDPLFLFVDISKVKEVYESVAKFMENKDYKVKTFKMHPRFNAESMSDVRSEYIKVLQDVFGDNLMELPADTVLENVLSYYKCDFYSCNSSTSIYASQAGANCYSIMPLLKGTPAYETNEFIESCNIQIE